MKQTSDEKMAEAEAWLQANSICPAKPTPYVLKIGGVNFFPSTGAIFVDREAKRRTAKGLNALAAILGLPQPLPQARPPETRPPFPPLRLVE